MRFFLILATLIFSDFAFSQGNSNDTILICENKNQWFGVQLNSDLEKVSYIEFGDFFYKGNRVYDINEPTREWKKAQDIRFTLETISFYRQSDFVAWEMRINRESLNAKLKVWPSMYYYYDNLTCTIVENKDVLKTRIDLEIKKKQLEKQKKLQQEKDEAERKRLEKEAKKKKNKI
jgi:hypothetical protein